MGKSWQLGTIQIDFSLPEKFNLTYVDSSNQLKRPIMIHRAIFGSIERFFGILLEHYKGNLPLWLSPIQVRILTINENYQSYATSILNILKENNLNVEEDFRNESLNKKIVEAVNQKIPYLLIIGEKELKNNTVTIRYQNQNQIMGIESFINLLKEKIIQKN